MNLQPITCQRYLLNVGWVFCRKGACASIAPGRLWPCCSTCRGVVGHPTSFVTTQASRRAWCTSLAGSGIYWNFACVCHTYHRWEGSNCLSEGVILINISSCHYRKNFSLESMCLTGLYSQRFLWLCGVRYVICLPQTFAGHHAMRIRPASQILFRDLCQVM